MPSTGWRRCPRRWSTGWSCWSSCCRANTHVLVCDPELVRGRAIDLVKTSEEFLHASWAAAAGGGQAPIDLGASSYRPLADVRAAALARGLAWWTLSPVQRRAGRMALRQAHGRIDPAPRTARSSTSAPRSARVGVESRIIAGQIGETYRGDTESAVNDIAKRIRDGWRVVLMAEGKGMSARMAEVLTEHDLPVRTRGGPDRAARSGHRHRGHRRPEPRLRRRHDQARRLHRRRPVRSAVGRQGQPQDAGPAQEPDRPARAHPRRPGGAQPARRRPLRARWCSAPSPARPGSTW